MQALELSDFCGSSVEEGGSSDVNLGLSCCGTMSEDEGFFADPFTSTTCSLVGFCFWK